MPMSPMELATALSSVDTTPPLQKLVQSWYTPVADNVVPFVKKEPGMFGGTEGARTYMGGSSSRVGSPQWNAQYEAANGLRPGTLAPSNAGRGDVVQLPEADNGDAEFAKALQFLRDVVADKPGENPGGPIGQNRVRDAAAESNARTVDELTSQKQRGQFERNKPGASMTPNEYQGSIHLPDIKELDAKAGELYGYKFQDLPDKYKEIVLDELHPPAKPANAFSLKPPKIADFLRTPMGKWAADSGYPVDAVNKAHHFMTQMDGLNDEQVKFQIMLMHQRGEI